MALPDETTIYCSKCSSYNIGDDCCICKSCVKKIIDDVLSDRRVQINIAFEGTDERMMAHLHTFINKFEEQIFDAFEVQDE